MDAEGIDALIEQAEAALQHGDGETADALYEQARAIDPEDREVMALAIMLAGARDDREGIVDAVDRLLEVHDDDPLALVTAAGWMADFVLDPDVAIGLLEKADELLEGEPELRDVRVEALVLLAACRGDAGDPVGALEAAEAARALAGPTIDVEIATAKAEMDMRRFADAAARLAPRASEDPEAAWLLGWAERLQGRDVEAAMAFDQARRAPGFPRPMHLDPAVLGARVEGVMETLPAPMRKMLAGLPVEIAPYPRATLPPRSALVIEGDEQPAKIQVFHKNVEVLATNHAEVDALLEALLVRELAGFLDDEDG